MSLPAVSCYTSTYGRVHCLNELVQSFLQQDYKGPKQLVILNDYDEQELIFNHPEVVIVNQKERIKPLGAKFNKNIELCSHDILVCMEDDDLYLPNHISYAVEHMKDGIFHTGVAWVWTAPGKLHHSGNYFHASHVFTRELFERAGKYPLKDNCTVDVGIMGEFQRAIGHAYTQHPKFDDITYIYRWGNQSYHASGYGTQINNVTEMATNAVQHQKGLGKVPTGKVILNPHWKEDYVQLAQWAAEEKKNGNS